MKVATDLTKRIRCSMGAVSYGSIEVTVKNLTKTENSFSFDIPFTKITFFYPLPYWIKEGSKVLIDFDKNMLELRD